MAAENPNIIWEKKLVGRPEGTDYSRSHKGAPGDRSPLLRSGADQSLAGQALIRDIPERKKSATGSAVVDVLTDIAIAAAIVGLNAFIDKGIPAIKQRVAEKRAQRLAAKSSDTPATDVAAVGKDIEPPVGDEVAELGTEIDAQLWYRLFFDAVTHGAASRAHQSISAEAWQALASARVTDDPETQALASAMRELTSEEVSDRVDRVLERHPELLNEDSETVLRRLFDHSGDDSLEPLVIERDDVAPGTQRYLAAEEVENAVEEDDESPQ